jgi:IS5 family transposase
LQVKIEKQPKSLQKMKPKKIENNQNDIFQSRLSEQLNPKHELMILGRRLNWASIEAEFSSIYEDKGYGGQPPKPARLMAGLMLLQNMHGLSDESVVAMWVENPYWQHFCGYDHLQWKFPIDGSSLTRWRKRLGSEKIEELLKLTVEVAVKVGMVDKKDLQSVIVDTTVMPKNIEFPTDSGLMNKSRERLVKLADVQGIRLRQKYSLIGPRLAQQIGRYFHAKQMKRGQKAVQKMKTILGRVVRDCERKIAGNDKLEQLFSEELKMARHLIARSKKDKSKLYSLHEPAVECISKGKARKPYEFGCKVAIAITHKKGKGLIVGSQAVHGNPFDGHTLEGSLQQSERITGIKVVESYVDRGYKGHGVKDSLTFISGQRRGVTKARAIKIKRRQAIEPYIGHMKKIGKLGLCRLKGKAGDEANALLGAAGYNLKLILTFIRDFLPHFWLQLILILAKTSTQS